MPDQKEPIPQFAKRIKQKYPQYKDVDDTLLVQKIVEKYPNYADQVDMGDITSKKKVGGIGSLIGGQAGTSEAPSGDVPIIKTKIQEIVESGKQKERKAIEDYAYSLKTPEQKQLAQETPKTAAAKAYNIGGERLPMIMAGSPQDPLGAAKKFASEKTDPQDAIADYMAARIIEEDTPGSMANEIVKEGRYKPDTETGKFLAKKAEQYNKVAEPLRELGDISYENQADFGTRWRIQDALIKAYANKNKQFRAQAEAAGVDFKNGQDFHLKLGDITGSIISEALSDEDLIDYIQTENPSLYNSIKLVSDNLLIDNKPFGVNVVANEISRARQKEGYNNPIVELDNEQFRKETDLVAESLYRDDPVKMQIYNEEIRNNPDKHIDTPSLLEGFAHGASGVYKGIGNTFTNQTKSIPEHIRKGWETEAAHVTADPKGLSKFLSGTGHVLGLVSALGGVTSVLGGGGAGIYSGRVAPALAGMIPFWGDFLQEGVMKYPDSPVKAVTSASLNTILYGALSQRIFPAKEVKAAFEKVKPGVANIVENLASGKITREVARQEANTLLKQGLSLVSGGIKKSAKISAELTGITAASRGLDKLFMDEETFDQYHDEDELKDTFGSLFLDNLVLGGMTKYSSMRRGNKIVEESLYEAATNPMRYERVINEMEVKDPTISKENMLSNLRMLVDTKRELDQRGIAPANQRRYLFEAAKEKALVEQRESMPESNLTRKHDEEIKRGQEVKESILRGEDVEPVVIDQERDLNTEGAVDPSGAIQKAIESGDIKGANLDTAQKALSEGKVDGFMKEVAEQAQDETGNLGVDNYRLAMDNYGVDVVDLAVKMFPKAEQKQAVPDEGGRIERVEQKVETDNAVMGGIKTDYVEVDGQRIELPEEGYFIDAVYLKEGKEKGRGSGQELYKKALDEHGVLYSRWPISEDAMRVHDKLEEKGIAKIEQITLPDGTELRKITKVQPTKTTVSEAGAAPVSDVSSKTWYRGVNKNNKEQGDRFYSEDESTAGDYAINKVGEEPTMTKLSKEELPKNPLVVGTKEDLAETIGFPEENIYDLKGDFDKKAKEYAQSKGHDAIVYESGSMGNSEMHVFGKPSDVSSGVDAAKPVIVETVDTSVVQKQMKPITDKMAEIEMQFSNEGLKIDWDYDAEIAITDKRGEFVEPNELPESLKKLAADYEAATGKLSNFDHSSFSQSLDASRKSIKGEDTVFEVEGKTELPPPKPPQEPPTDKPEGGRKGRLNDKGILSHLHEATGVPQAAKEGFAREGLRYESKSRKEAESIAKNVIEFAGMDEALSLAESQKFDGDVNSMIFAESLNRLAEQSDKETDPVKKAELDTRFKEVGLAYDKAARSGGRFSSAIDYFYRKSPLGVVMIENEKRRQEFTDWSKPKDKSWKEFFEELKKDPEFEKVFQEEVKEGIKEERKAARESRKKKVDEFFDKAKDQFKGGAAYSTIVPPKVITAALEGMRQAYHAGEKVAELIEKAVDYISEQLGTAAWDKDKFRKEWTAKLNDKDGKKPLTDEEVKTKILDKFRKKLKGLSDKERDEVIRKSFAKIVDSGGLDYADFRDIIGQVTGRTELTPEQAERLKQLVKITNSVDEAAQKAREQRTPEALADFRKAEIEAGKAAKELQEMFGNKPDVVRRLTSIMQLNTLGIASLVNNPIYNIWNQATLRFPAGVINDAIDRFGKRSEQEYNVWETQGEFWNKLGLGSAESMKQLFTGLNRMDYIQKEVQGDRIRPAKSWRDLIAKIRGKKKMSGAQTIDKILQGTAGVPAEIVARLLNVGDKPQRFAAEGAQASAFAKALGLKDMDYRLFIEFPREEAYNAYKALGFSDAEAGQKADYVKEAMIKEGQRSTFQQYNLFNDFLTRAFGVFGGKDSGTATLLKTLTVSPYIKIPSNAFWSFYNLLNPEIALLQSMVHKGRSSFYKGKGEYVKQKMQNREARYWFAHAMVGMASRAVVLGLLQSGALNVTPSSDDDESKKERDATSLYNKAGSVQIGDMKVSLRWFGQPGMLFNSIGKKHRDATPEQREAQDEFWNIVLGGMELEGLKEAQNGLFANSSSLLQSVDSHNFDRYITNSLNMMANIIQPASIAQFNRANIDEVPNSRGDNLLDKLNKQFAQRSPLYRNITNTHIEKKLDIWGQPIPKGGNILTRMLGISKADTKQFGRPIYEDAVRTGDSGFLPPAVMPILNGEKLKERQYQDLQNRVGTDRKNLVAPYVNGMAIIGGYNVLYSQLSDEDKKYVLTYLYGEGRRTGLEKFYQDYPELKPKKEEKDYNQEAKQNVFKILQKYKK